MPDAAKRITPAKARDYLAAAREAGFDPQRAIITPAGGIELIFADGATMPLSPLDEWRARKGHD